MKHAFVWHIMHIKWRHHETSQRHCADAFRDVACHLAGNDYGFLWTEFL
jgi:hypothetical protein